MTTGMPLGTTCSDRSHERPMAPFALVCTVTPAPCTAHVIAALFVLAAIRAAGCCTETRVFINRGLVQVVGRGHWPPQPVPLQPLSTLPLVVAAKRRVK